jgi:hypothetical protein
MQMSLTSDLIARSINMPMKAACRAVLLTFVLVGAGFSSHVRADDVNEEILHQQMTKVRDVLITAKDDTPDANDKIKLLRQAIDMIKHSSYGMGPIREKIVVLINKAIDELKRGDPDNHAANFIRMAADMC